MCLFPFNLNVALLFFIYFRYFFVFIYLVVCLLAVPRTESQDRLYQILQVQGKIKIVCVLCVGVFSVPRRCVQMLPVSVCILKMLLKQALKEGMGGRCPCNRKSLSFSQSGRTSCGMTRHLPSHI